MVSTGPLNGAQGLAVKVHGVVEFDLPWGMATLWGLLLEVDGTGSAKGAYTAVAYARAPARIEVSFMMVVSFEAGEREPIQRNGDARVKNGLEAD